MRSGYTVQSTKTGCERLQCLFWKIFLKSQRGCLSKGGHAVWAQVVWDPTKEVCLISLMIPRSRPKFDDQPYHRRVHWAKILISAIIRIRLLNVSLDSQTILLKMNVSFLLTNEVMKCPYHLQILHIRNVITVVTLSKLGTATSKPFRSPTCRNHGCSNLLLVSDHI